jgi:hypothetical protein
MKQKYTVVVSFKYAGHWREPGELLELLACESAQLLRVGKIKLAASLSTKSKGAAE